MQSAENGEFPRETDESPTLVAQQVRHSDGLPCPSLAPDDAKIMASIDKYRRLTIAARKLVDDLMDHFLASQENADGESGAGPRGRPA
ncbi:MAG: hypothetical protein O3C40_36010 [Planctomycetota bacterium]|nr:hypothetical protein [Planctomycetota bacterium]